MSNEAVNTIQELFKATTDRELQKTQTELAAARVMISELQSQIEELKKTPPEVQKLLDSHEAALKVQRIRVKEATQNMDASQREVILVKRELSAARTEIAEKDKTIRDLRGQLESVSTIESVGPGISVEEPTASDSTSTKIRRSQRSSRIPG